MPDLTRLTVIEHHFFTLFLKDPPSERSSFQPLISCILFFQSWSRTYQSLNRSIKVKTQFKQKSSYCIFCFFFNLFSCSELLFTFTRAVVFFFFQAILNLLLYTCINKYSWCTMCQKCVLKVYRPPSTQRLFLGTSICLGFSRFLSKSNVYKLNHV